jgi:hypothetical protein
VAFLWQSLAFSAAPRELSDPAWGEVVRLKPHQILLWVSLTHRGLERLPSATPRLPVLLDTGHNHNFSLREEHLVHSGLESPWPWSSVPLRVRDASGIEREVPRLLVDVWLHPDPPHLGTTAYPLRLGFRGAACYTATSAVSGPHLPLLGLAALCAGSLTVALQCSPTGGTVGISIPAVP